MFRKKLVSAGILKKGLTSVVMAVLLGAMPKFSINALAYDHVNTIINTGYDYSMSIGTDDSLWAWGYNPDGLLGDGTITGSLTPVKIMDDVLSVSSGDYYTQVIKTDGSLWAWGNNSYGQLGDGTTADRRVPVKIMDNVMSVATGVDHVAAIKKDGSLWAWGRNNRGQLGDGTTTDSPTPIKVMDDVIAIAAGYWLTQAIKNDGTLWAWGGNDCGAVGDGTTVDRFEPVEIMNDVVSVATGLGHTLAIKTDSSLWAWGWNERGQLGDGTMSDKYTPIKIMDEVTLVSTKFNFTMVLKIDDSLFAWGRNDHGQLGDGTTTDSSIPVKVMDDIVSVAAGVDHVLAIGTDGSLWAWGDNSAGQVGDSTTESRYSPVKIMDDVMLPMNKAAQSLSQNTPDTILFRVLTYSESEFVEGASVYIDGKYVGMTGQPPLTVSVETGERIIKIEKSGFMTVEMPLEISNDFAEIERTFNLQPTDKPIPYYISEHPNLDPISQSSYVVMVTQEDFGDPNLVKADVKVIKTENYIETVVADVTVYRNQLPYEIVVTGHGQAYITVNVNGRFLRRVSHHFEETTSKPLIDYAQLNTVIDPVAASVAVNHAVKDWTPEQKADPANIDAITFFAETSISNAAALKTDSNYILLTDQIFSSAQDQAAETRGAVAQVLSEAGIYVNREIRSEVKIQSSSQDTLTVVLDTSLKNIAADTIRVEGAGAGISFSRQTLSEIVDDSGLVITIDVTKSPSYTSNNNDTSAVAAIGDSGYISYLEVATTLYSLLADPNATYTSSYRYPDVNYDAPLISNIVNFVSSEGYMIGGDTGLFMTNQLITRASVASIVCEAFDLLDMYYIPTPIPSAFPDTDNHWARGYIFVAALSKIIEGIWEDGQFVFKPDDYITRSDFEQVISNILQKGYGISLGQSFLIAEGDTPRYTITFSEPITGSITLALPKDESDVAYQAIINENGDVIGGKYNPTTDMIEGKITESGTYIVKNNYKDFSEIQHLETEMQDAIRYLASKGIIDSELETAFVQSPDDTISRAEIASLIIRAIAKYDPNFDGGYSDVFSADWYFGAAGSTRRYEILDDFGDNTFRGLAVIVKDQLISAAAKTLITEMGYFIDVDVDGELARYYDSHDISDPARVYVAVATKIGLVIVRSDTQFMPGADMTRGDAAIIIRRLYEKLW